MYNGMGRSMENLFRLSKSQSRSICPENFDGAKGGGGMCEVDKGISGAAAADLGKGWKVNPFLIIQPGETFVLADIEGPGCIQHIWMTDVGEWRFHTLRIYWDDEVNPSVECPLGDFFACGWGKYAHVNSLAVCVNPGSAFNCYWQMPFKKRCKITLENISTINQCWLYYQIDYCLSPDMPDNIAYFHAHYRRVNPVPFKELYTIVDGIQGQGQYVGTYMCWGVNNNGWWGEGEIKFFIDGDKEFPTICGTGTEDYFCGSYNFEDQVTKQYTEFTTAYAGLPQVIRPDGLYQSQQRFGMYRWHITDPIYFQSDLKVNIQALGWKKSNRKYLPLQDDISSVAFWYQTLPTAPFKPYPTRDELEVI